MAETFIPLTTSNLTNQTSITAAIDSNFATLQTLLNDVLSRSGSNPNSMSSNLDMNSNQLINLGAPTTANSALRLQDISSVVSSSGTVTNATVVVDATTVSSATTVSDATTVTSATNVTNAGTVTNPSSISNLWVPSSKTTNYTVVSGDNSSILNLSGGYFTVTLPAASGFASNFNLMLYNADTNAGKTIAPNGLNAFILWPKQWCRIGNISNTWVVLQNTPLWVLPSNTTFNVNANTGSDSNDGLAAPFLTIAGALDVLKPSVFAGNSTVTLQLTGNFNVGAGINVNYGQTLSNIVFNGNSGNPAAVTVTCNAGGFCFNSRDGASTITVQNLLLATAGSGSVALQASQSSDVDFGNVIFNNFSGGSHVKVFDCGTVNVNSSYTVNGSAAAHIQAFGPSKFNNTTGATVTGASSLAFTVFAEATDGGVIQGAPTYSGFSGVTGIRYISNNNAVIDTNGAGANFYPGNSAGTTADGGQYI